MSCFTQPLAGTYGTEGSGIAPRNNLRQPGINNWDMGLTKSFPITERAQFNLRFDTFNTFNHHQYDINTGGYATGGSGGGSSIDNGVDDAPNVAGRITSSSAARIIQLSGKFTF
jgi:hypothetical protein